MSNPVLPTLPETESSSLPLPLLVAQKWKFPLAFAQTDEGTFYAVQDWIAGLIGSHLR
ncbi:MAG: hypothetical protein SF029_07215 [bacterium]|nr:hypothetical protein [bacterium]